MNELKPFWKSLLLLFFSFTFANYACVALHEIGHVLAIFIGGVNNVKLFIHPYLSSYVRWSAIPELIGYIDAAGPLFNIAMSVILFLALYRIRRPMLLPFLLMAPISMFQEGLNSMMQVFLGSPGTDSMNIIKSGVPLLAVLFLSIVFFIAGILLFTSLLEMFAIKNEHPFWRTFLIIFGATGLNMVFVILFSLFQRPDEVLRGIILLALMLIFSIVFAGLKKTKLIRTFSIISPSGLLIDNVTLLVVFLIAAIPVAMGVIFF